MQPFLMQSPVSQENVMNVFLLMGLWFLQLAISQADGLPHDYWQHPKAGEHIQGDSPLERNLRPEACAQCHQTQFDAWKGSRHALAYSPGMVGQFSSMGHQEGNDCLVCHAPLERQLYRHSQDLEESLSLIQKFSQGFDGKADLDAMPAHLPLRHAGVSCAVCHIRDGHRFGPPRKGSDVVGQLSADAHGGFIANQDFKKSNFCASCHQFPQDYAINGKPLENIVNEWKQSRFAREGVQCQNCHMPDRQHLFRGIHDKDMVRSGLSFETSQGEHWAALNMTSMHIGHAFPSYVTPQVDILAQGLDKDGEEVQRWTWALSREVFYDDGWQEKQDSRLMPGKSRLFMASGIQKNVVHVKFQVNVIPDHYYKSVYEDLLQDMQVGTSRTLIERALLDAKRGDYRLYQRTIRVHP